MSDTYGLILIRQTVLSPCHAPAMKKLIATAWMSLDGVFDAETMETWFMPYQSDGRNESVRELILASDALVVGRTTYELLAGYWSTKTNNSTAGRPTRSCL